MDGWCFATINGRLAEIFWWKGKGGKRHITSHAYVKRSEYKTKKELRWIDKESKAYRFSFRKGRYNRLAAS